MEPTPNTGMLEVAATEEERREIIRALRHYCFEIVNRGGLWYDTLTIVEKNELLQWYQDWLDAPDNLTIPEKPTWLD